jgi:hypothetical protein
MTVLQNRDYQERSETSRHFIQSRDYQERSHVIEATQ